MSDVANHAIELTFKLIILSAVLGIVSISLIEAGTIVLFFWGIVATFLTAFLYLSEANKLNSKGTNSNSSLFNSEHTLRPQKDLSEKSQEEMTDLEKVKTNQQKSEPGWVSLRGENYMHRKVDKEDRGVIMEVGDGNKTGEFLIQDDQVTIESSNLEQKHGEKWVKEAKAYLKEYVV